MQKLVTHDQILCCFVWQLGVFVSCLSQAAPMVIRGSHTKLFLGALPPRPQIYAALVKKVGAPRSSLRSAIAAPADDVSES